MGILWGSYGDKNRGQGELRVKCRIVALGHRDPDLFQIDRSRPTPSRSTEHVLLCCAVAGWNKELNDTLHLWHTWMGSASTAFLQGTQEDASRPLPPTCFHQLMDSSALLFSPLYLVCGNIYNMGQARRIDMLGTACFS